MIQLVMITGLSGSGKTLALKCLEDMGFFCVDNLPSPLIEPFIELFDRSEDQLPRGAFVVDARERAHFESLPEILGQIRQRDDVRLDVLFLEADLDALVRRYSISRRPHPVAQHENIGISEALVKERDLLAPLRALADRVVRTDDLSPHDLRRLIMDGLSTSAKQLELVCRILSFGFKFGVPRNVDMVFDVRFLDNPYFVPELRPLDGRSEAIVEFLGANSDYRRFLEIMEEMLSFVMPRFVHEGKSYLTLAVGCTGGRHRSVAVAEHLAQVLIDTGYTTSITHRDLEREGKTERE